MVKLDRRTAEYIIATGAAIDFLMEGKFTAPVARAIKSTAKKAFPLAARAAVGTAGVAGRSALGAALPIVTNPYAAGLALGYGALQTQPGQQLLETAEERGRMDRIRFEQALTDLQVGVGRKVKKTKSKFNTAVSKGMATIKAGTSYGKKGVINAPKKAFAAVTKLASKINKAKQSGNKFPSRPKAPNPRKLYNTILKVLK
jgi:hypothetical protein|tara:strand:+ start:48 stop:650 length:603 start_codon:yes stop_codon:yes gene_type:complete